jgi:hypothetical protein
MSTKEQAEALGIPTVDEDGKEIHHKTLAKLIAEKEAEATQGQEPVREAEESSVNKDGFEAGTPLTSAQLLKHMAEQRNKTGNLNAYAKVKKPRQRKAKTRSKIHANAADK